MPRSKRTNTLDDGEREQGPKSLKRTAEAELLEQFSNLMDAEEGRASFACGGSIPFMVEGHSEESTSRDKDDVSEFILKGLY